MDEEVREKCLEPGRLRFIASLPERQRLAEDAHFLSARFLRAARHLVGTDAEQSVVIEGFFAMEAKANELLAIAGIASKSHYCTAIALSRILGEKRLAEVFARAYDDRLALNYTHDVTQLRSAGSPREFLGVVEGFLAEANRAIVARQRPP